MPAKYEYINGKRLIVFKFGEVNIPSTSDSPATSYSWVKFEGLTLHHRDAGFFMDNELGYEECHADLPILREIITEIFASEQLPEKREIFSAGAWDDLGFKVYPSSGDEPYLDDVIPIIASVLIRNNYAIKMVHNDSYSKG